MKEIEEYESENAEHIDRAITDNEHIQHDGIVGKYQDNISSEHDTNITASPDGFYVKAPTSSL